MVRWGARSNLSFLPRRTEPAGGDRAPRTRGPPPPTRNPDWDEPAAASSRPLQDAGPNATPADFPRPPQSLAIAQRVDHRLDREGGRIRVNSLHGATDSLPPPGSAPAFRPLQRAPIDVLSLRRAGSPSALPAPRIRRHKARLQPKRRILQQKPRYLVHGPRRGPMPFEWPRSRLASSAPIALATPDVLESPSGSPQSRWSASEQFALQSGA